MGNFLPNELIDRLKLQKGFDVDAFRDVHESDGQGVSIRLNPKKISESPYAEAKTVPWCNYGYSLSERPVFPLDPLYHAGCYYVQEASSMFLAHILTELRLTQTPIRAIDLFAAAGESTTLLSSYLHSDSLLVANQGNKSAVNMLEENLIRWGVPNSVITNNDPFAFSRLPGYFDLMVLDAPCSGSGLLGKDDGAADAWSLANVKLYSDRQKRILAGSIACLQQEGYLVYSTYSYSNEENEDILDWLISEHGLETVQISIDLAWGIEETNSKESNAFGYRFYPHKTKGEGFFIAVLKEVAEQPSFDRTTLGPAKSIISNQALGEWLSYPEKLTAFQDDEEIRVFPSLYVDDLTWLKSVLSVCSAGVNIGKWTEKELVPSLDLALSFSVRKDINKIDLSLESALEYLDKGVLKEDDFANVGVGWYLPRYQGVNLGWVKV